MAWFRELLTPRAFGRRFLLGAALAALPVGVILLDFHPGALAGCGTYGYACTQTACFTVEISTNQGYSWQKGTAWIYGAPGAPIDLYVRTTMTANVNKVGGWSFGVKHTAPTLAGAGGAFYVKGAQRGPAVATIQAGAPPDFEATKVWDCGFTQGVVIDFDAAGHTIGPTTNLVTALVCYRVTIPQGSTVHVVNLAFTADVGTPPVASAVSREGQSISPCVEALALKVQPTNSYPTPSYCPVPELQPQICDAGGGGAGLGEEIPFIRGDAQPEGAADGDVDLSDAISLLNFLFLAGPEPACLEAADANESDDLDVSDPVFILLAIFAGTVAIAEPFPGCGLVPTPSSLTCEASFCSTSSEYSPNLSSGMVRNQSETAVAINPTDRNNVVIVANLWTVPPGSPAETAPGFFHAVTMDGGRTWTPGVLFTSGPGAGRADPALAFDGFGNLYFVYGGFPGGLKVAVSRDKGVTFPDNLVTIFPTGGDRPAVAAGPAFDGSQSVWVVARTNGQIHAWGSVVSGMVDDLSDLCFSGAIEVTEGCNSPCAPCPVGQKCADGECVPCAPGENCNQPTPPCVPCGLGEECQQGLCVPAPGEPGTNCGRLTTRLPGSPGVVATADPDLDCFCNYADVAVGPSGEVMVAYNNGAQPDIPTRPDTVFVKLRASAPPDLPSFAEPGFSEVLRVRSNVCSLQEAGVSPRGFDYVPARPRLPQDEKGVVPAPDLTWDRGRSHRVYLAFLDKPALDLIGSENHDTNVALLYADPPYTTWLPQEAGQPKPKVVNDDYSVNPPSAVNSQFFQRIAVDQTTGHVALSWYDTRPAIGQPVDLTKVRYFATFSTDMAQTFFPSFPVGSGTTEAVPLVVGPPQQTLGDYTALAFHGGVFYPVWADNSGSVTPDSNWVRINAGGPEETEAGGIVWQADSAYLGQPAGAPFPLMMTQDASGVTERPAPPAVYQTVRHSANALLREAHEFTITGLAPVVDDSGAFDLRVHFSRPSQLAGPENKFNFFIEDFTVGQQVLSDYDPGLDAPPSASVADYVVVKEFWSVVSGGPETPAGLQFRSVPSLPAAPASADSFELAIEASRSTHSDIWTTKVVVKEVEP